MPEIRIPKEVIDELQLILKKYEGRLEVEATRKEAEEEINSFMMAKVEEGIVEAPGVTSWGFLNKNQNKNIMKLIKRRRLVAIKDEIKQQKENLKSLLKEIEDDATEIEDDESEDHINAQDELVCCEEAVLAISTAIGHLADALRHKKENSDSTSIEAAATQEKKN